MAPEIKPRKWGGGGRREVNGNVLRAALFFVVLIWFVLNFLLALELFIRPNNREKGGTSCSPSRRPAKNPSTNPQLTTKYQPRGGVVLTTTNNKVNNIFTYSNSSSASHFSRFSSIIFFFGWAFTTDFAHLLGDGSKSIKDCWTKRPVGSFFSFSLHSIAATVPNRFARSQRHRCAGGGGRQLFVPFAR